VKSLKNKITPSLRLFSWYIIENSDDKWLVQFYGYDSRNRREILVKDNSYIIDGYRIIDMCPANKIDSNGVKFATWGIVSNDTPIRRVYGSWLKIFERVNKLK
jgi:hypothetical protein